MRIFIRSLLVCLAGIILFNSDIYSQTFEKLNGPYGGGGKVYEGKNGVLFQIYDVGGTTNILHKSIDGGISWIKMPAVPSELFTHLSVGLDGNLYTVNSSTLYKSIDDGQTWDIMKSTPEVKYYATALPDGTVLVSTYNKVLQSSDNGQTWHSSNLPNIAKNYESDHFYYNIKKDELFAFGNDSIFVSEDKGLSWKLFYSDNFGSGYLYQDIVVAANGNMFISGDDYIWVFDGAGNFIKKLDPFNEIDFMPIDIAISNSGKLFVYKFYRSLYSDDLGETWVEFGSSLTLSSNTAFHSFAVAKSGTLFGVKDGGGLFRSNDDGKHWKFSAQGMNYPTVTQVNFISESKILAVTMDGLFYSDDAGASWTFLQESHDAPWGSFQTNHVINIKNEFYFVDFTGISYYKDSKTAAIVLSTFPDSLFVDYDLYLNPSSGSMFFQSSGVLYKSNDKAVSWYKLPISEVKCFYAFPDGILLVSASNGIFKSMDDGENWNLVFAYGIGAGDVSRIIGNSFSGAYLLYYNNQNLNIASTNDYGTSWNITGLDSASSINFNPVNGLAVNNLDYLYMGGLDYNIYISFDLGHTFNLISYLVNMSDLTISPEQKLYVLTYEDGLYRMNSQTSNIRVLKGKIYLDKNSDCDKNANESGLANQLIVANNGTKKEFGYSKANGNFIIPVESGNYSLEVKKENDYWSSCDKTIFLASYDLNDTLQLGLKVNTLCPYLKVDIEPSLLRRCFETIIFIKYANTGTLNAVNAFIDIELDPFFEFVTSSKSLNSKNGNVYRFLLGDLEENSNGYFTITAKVSCNAKLGQIHCAEAHIYPDSSCERISQAIVRTSANCVGDSIDLIVRNDGNKAMSSTKSWRVIDESNSNYQDIDEGNFFLGIGQVFTKRILSHDHILFMAEQDDSYPYNKYSKTEINDCTTNPLPGSPGLSIINEDEEEPYLSRFCEPNIGSFDPNEITGFPIGITDKRYIDNDQQLEYIIRFQNTGTDTAFSVRVENKIPVELDKSTLSLGASSHPYEYLLSPDGKLIVTFTNIMLPDSNINEATSHGFIQYSIKPLDKLSNGTKILNDAQIYFDYNEPVNTNVDLHTIGSPVAVKVNEVQQENEIDFQIKPNPMQDLSTVLINAKSKTEQYKLSCLDVHSRQMWEKDVTGNRAVISKGELNPGVYLLVLKTKNGLPMKSRKFIVE